MSESDVAQLVESLKALGIDFHGHGGWTLAGVAAALTAAIRLWQMPFAQNIVRALLGLLAGGFPAAAEKLSGWLVWDNLSPLQKWAMPIVSSAALAVAGGGMGAFNWGAALLSFLALSAGSIGAHHGTKAVGSAVAAAAPKTVEALHPAVRSAISIAVPLPSPAPVSTPDATPAAPEPPGGAA